MKKNRWLLRAVVLVLLSGILTTSVSLAAEAGSSEDPLVTLSYLNGTFLDSILERVDEKIAQRNICLHHAVSFLYKCFCIESCVSVNIAADVFHSGSSVV